MTVRGGVTSAGAPAAYDFNPNKIQLDQAVVYIERTPDTVQTDHVDWGFRVSAIYGTDYRYTTSYGLASYQLLVRHTFIGAVLNGRRMPRTEKVTAAATNSAATRRVGLHTKPITPASRTRRRALPTVRLSV